MPDLSLELPHFTQGRIVAGVDEAGRGPWAGPVVAAAVILDIHNIPDGIDDSKALSAKRREALFAAIIQSAVVGVGIADVAEIDTLNILGATKLAMQRAVAELQVRPQLVLVDGNQPPELPCLVQAVISGDSISLSIAAASVIAKVTRDQIMCKLAQEYPLFGWERNAGYGTREHQNALTPTTVTPHHRKSFAPVRRVIGVLCEGE